MMNKMSDIEYTKIISKIIYLEDNYQQEEADRIKTKLRHKVQEECKTKPQKDIEITIGM